MNPWALSYDRFDPSEEGRRETLCTLGNGYFATRGAVPEARADGVHYPGTYVAGCYNRLTSAVAGHTMTNEELVNVPNWLPLAFANHDLLRLNPLLPDQLSTLSLPVRVRGACLSVDVGHGRVRVSRADDGPDRLSIMVHDQRAVLRRGMAHVFSLTHTQGHADDT